LLRNSAMAFMPNQTIHLKPDAARLSRMIPE
jgi:hypothetical protein